MLNITRVHILFPYQIAELVHFINKKMLMELHAEDEQR